MPRPAPSPQSTKIFKSNHPIPSAPPFNPSADLILSCQYSQQQILTNMKLNQRNDNLSFLDKYSIYHKSMDSDDTVLKDKASGEFVLMREVTIEDNDNFKQIIETLEEQKELKHSHLLYLLEYHIKSFQSQASTFHKVITFYEYSSHCLNEEVEARLQEQRPFEQSQLWNILCSAVLGLSYLQKENIGHGSISLIDIYITQDGLVKIIDPSIASSSPFNLTEGYYYSPEILKYYASSQQDEGVNIFKSDVFILAACMMHVALLEPIDDCYNYESHEIDFDALQSKLEIIGQHYSEEFVSTLADMLSEDSDERPDLGSMEEKLLTILGQENEVTESISLIRSRKPQGIQPTLPDAEDNYPALQGKPNDSCLDFASTPDEALYLPVVASVAENKQVIIGSQNITLQSSIRGKPLQNSIHIKESTRVDRYPTVTVIPHSPIKLQHYGEQPPNMNRRTSEDIIITITPPNVPAVLQQRTRPTTNYQQGATHYQNYLKENLSAKKLSTYAASQVTTQTQNKPYNYSEQSTFSISQISKYPPQTQPPPPTTYVPYTPMAPTSQFSQINPNSHYKKRSIAQPSNPAPSYIPAYNTTVTTPKTNYGLSQLAPLQSQSIQINSLAHPTLTNNLNPISHLAQPLLANTKLAPMITSNAVHSKESHAHLFTDPNLLSMMRADIRKYENYNRQFIETEYSKPYFRY